MVASRCLWCTGELAGRLGGVFCLHGTNGDRQIHSPVPAVSLFDAASFQHSPANMAFFSLAAGIGVGPAWSVALGWSIPERRRDPVGRGGRGARTANRTRS
jgi:hypothetical protein